MTEELIKARITVANYDEKQGAKGSFMTLGHKNPDGTWLNLSVFDTELFPFITKGAELDIGYTEKYATEPSGKPKIDDRTGQQKVYRNIQTIDYAGQAPQQAAPATQSASGASSEAQRGNIPTDVSVRQTAANCAIQKAETVEDFDKWFDHVLARVTNQATPNEFDAFMAKAKTEMGATDDIGFEKGPKDDGDSDIPF